MLGKVARLGPYRLLTRLSAGGTAEVYLAQVKAPDGRDRVVAIKRILPEFADETDFATMLIDEARLVSQLIHTGITQVLDLGRDRGELYLAMEYVAGKDLAAVGKRLRSLKARLDPVLACHVMAEVLEALDYAHTAVGLDGQPMDLVHRDISPSNVIVSWDGEVKLIDFGIARATNRLTKTQTGVLKGKYRYMSPEQANGKPVDGRSDLYSASIVLFELLIGEKLYAGDSDIEIIEKVITGRVPRLKGRAGVSDELAAIVEKGVLKDVNKRWQTGHEYATRLREWLSSVAGGRDLTQELLVFMQNVFAKEHKEEREHLRRLLNSLDAEPPRVARPPPPPVEAVEDEQASTILQSGVPPEVLAALERGQNPLPEPEPRPATRQTPSRAVKPARPPPPPPPDETVVLRMPELTVTEASPDNEVNRRRRKGGQARLLVAAVAVVTVAAAVFVLRRPPPAQEVVEVSLAPPVQVVEVEVVPPEEQDPPAPEPAPEPERPRPAREARKRVEPAVAGKKDPPPAVVEAKQPAAEPAAVKTGKVRITAFPPGRLWIDGEETPHTTPVIDLEVESGPHVVWVVAPDGRRAEARIDVPEGGTLTKFVPY